MEALCPFVELFSRELAGIEDSCIIEHSLVTNENRRIQHFPHALETYRHSLFMDKSISIIVLDREAQSCRIDISMTPNKERTENRLRQKIQHAVEDRFGIGGNNITTYARRQR